MQIPGVIPEGDQIENQPHIFTADINTNIY
jgi:hypothetical protein